MRTQSLDVGQRAGALAERLLPRQVRRALLVLGGEVRGRPAEHLVLRRLEPAPHHFALRPRRERDLLPARLQLPHPAGRRLEVGLRLERVHLAAQLFLHLQVRPPLPFVGVAQLLHARTERGARLFEPRLDLLPILLRRERGAIVERRPDVAQRPIAGLEGDLLRGGQRFDLAAQLLEPAQVVLLLLRARLRLRVLQLLEPRDGALETLGRAPDWPTRAREGRRRRAAARATAR